MCYSLVLVLISPEKHGITPVNPATLKTGSLSKFPFTLMPNSVHLCWQTVLEALAGHAEPTEHPITLFVAKLCVEERDYLLVLFCLQKWL